MPTLTQDVSFASRYTRGSGLRLDACSFLGRRYRPDWLPYRHDAIEHWLLTTKPGVRFAVGYGASGRWFTGVWHSSEGALFVTDGVGRVHRHPNATRAVAPEGADEWQVDELGVPLDGIWGLSDSCVFAWGGSHSPEPNAELKARFSIFRWNGSIWQEIPSPGFDIRDIHGASDQHLLAVGRHGAVARFDGREWQREAVPVDQTLTSVFVVSDDEAYATGAHGVLLEGSRYGWGKIAQGPAPEAFPLYSVARWKSKLYVAAGNFGLLRRDGKSHRLVTVTEDIRPRWIDARENLVLIGDEVIADSNDGEHFQIAGRAALLRARAGRPLFDFGAG